MSPDVVIQHALAAAFAAMFTVGALQKLSEGSVVSQIWAQQCVRIQLGQLAYVKSETEEISRYCCCLGSHTSRS